MFAKIKNSKIARVFSCMMVVAMLCAMFAMPTYAASADDFTAATVAESTDTNFVMPRASTTKTLAGNTGVAFGSKYYAAGSSVTLSATWSPTSAEVALGYVDANGEGAGFTYTGGYGSVTITFNKAGTYALTVANLSSSTITVTYTY